MQDQDRQIALDGPAFVLAHVIQFLGNLYRVDLMQTALAQPFSVGDEPGEDVLFIAGLRVGWSLHRATYGSKTAGG